MNETHQTSADEAASAVVILHDDTDRMSGMATALIASACGISLILAAMAVCLCLKHSQHMLLLSKGMVPPPPASHAHKIGLSGSATRYIYQNMRSTS